MRYEQRNYNNSYFKNQNNYSPNKTVNRQIEIANTNHQIKIIKIITGNNSFENRNYKQNMIEQRNPEDMPMQNLQK